MTGHAIYWLTADPRLNRNAMVAVRNAWCGRFMTDELRCLKRWGVSARGCSLLGKYIALQLQLMLGCATACVAGMLVSYAVKIARPGMISIACSTALLGIVAVWIGSRIPSSKHAFERTLGLWLEYQKDAVMPPWVLQSSFGSQLQRTVLCYGAAAVLACSILALGLSDWNWTSRSISDLNIQSWLEVIVVGFAASVVSPAWVLLMGFIVSTPISTACQQVVEEACNDQD
jgi:hypothetical protein